MPETRHEGLPSFEDVDPRSVLGAGDVTPLGRDGPLRHHDHRQRSGILLFSNPATRSWRSGRRGRVRAKQTRYGLRALTSTVRRNADKVVPIVITANGRSRAKVSGRNAKSRDLKA